MNSWTVEIKDFQSLQRVHLDIVPGINIITGRTNIGKSAVIRAIDSALFNMGDDSMVRGGQRMSGVSIDNGTHKMLFCRDAKSTSEKTAYQFDDGTVQRKVGRTQLPEVAQMFNIRDVRMQNGTKMKINFWYQNDKPFLMDKTAGQLYEFLSLSSCDRYSRILKTMAADLKIQAADINNITTEIDTLKVVNNRKQDFIDKNAGYDDLYVKIVTADQQRRALQEIEDIISRLRDLSGKIKSSKSQLSSVSDRLSKLPLQELSDKFSEVQTSYANCSSLESDIQSINNASSRISDKTSVSNEVSKKFDGISGALSGMSERVQAVVQESANLRDIEQIHSICGTVKSKVERVSNRISEISSKDTIDSIGIQSRVSKIESETSECAILEGMLRSIKSLSDRSKGKKSDIESLDSKIQENDSELEVLKQSVGYCPYCGTVFEKKE